MLAQATITKPTQSQTLLSLNIQNIDDVFPGFMPGDFALVYGLPYVLPLSLLLVVRAQLPHQLGGLESNVIFVDGGNTFRLYKVSRLARLHHLRSRDALQRIFISRAFTMHQMNSIIFDELEMTTEECETKLVIISDLQSLYLDKDVQPEECKEVFSQVTAYISKFAKEKGLIVVATCLPHYNCRRSAFLHAVACARSNVTIAITKKRSYPFERQFVLEKHPLFKLGSASFPSETIGLNDFANGGING